MASPTEAELNAQWQNAVALLDNLLANQTVPADHDAYVQSLESDYAAQQAQGAELFRARVSTAVGSGSVVLDALLTAYAHHIVGVPERSPQRALDRIYQWFADNAKTVKSRGITYGSPTSFGAGKGSLLRLTKDENGYDLEAVHLEVKTAKCIRDAFTGASLHEEVFELRGEEAGKDLLAVSGSGLVDRSLRARTSRDSLVGNSSFTLASIGGSFSSGRYDFVAGDTLTDWEVLDGAGSADPTVIALERAGATNPYAKDVEGDTPTSVVFRKNGKLRQKFSARRVQFDSGTPYLPEVYVKRDAAVTAGTITLRWGSRSVSATLTSLTADAWVPLRGALDQNLYPANFLQADAAVEIEVSGLAGGEVAVDELHLGPMHPFDGTWWHVSGGSYDATATIVPFRLDDSATATDALTATDSKIQKWLWRAYGRHLPHSGTPTLADP